MTSAPVAAAVLELLRDRVTSFEELEALRLLYVEQVEGWSADAVGARLKIAPASAEEALERLREHGLLVSRVQSGITTYRYDAVDAALDATLARLVHAYSHDPIGIMKVMSANAVERVRGSVIRTFADAFIVGRKKDG